MQAELEVERGLVAQLKQEVAQFKEQSRLDFERIGALAEENQQLQVSVRACVSACALGVCVSGVVVIECVQHASWLFF